jgi:hypothetical protein
LLQFALVLTYLLAFCGLGHRIAERSQSAIEQAAPRPADELYERKVRLTFPSKLMEVVATALTVPLDVPVRLRP